MRQESPRATICHENPSLERRKANPTNAANAPPRAFSSAYHGRDLFSQRCSKRSANALIQNPSSSRVSRCLLATQCLVKSLAHLLESKASVAPSAMQNLLISSRIPIASSHSDG